MDIDAVVFDMDGVLLDTESVSKIAWKKVGAEYGFYDTEPVLKRITGGNIPNACRILREVLGDDFPAEEFRNRCSQEIQNYIQEHGLGLMPYAREILEYLKSRGYKICLASSTRKATVERQLKETGLIDFFITRTCGDMVENSKPHPQIYQVACASVGADPRKSIAVEDSPNGIRSAHAAGMMAVMVPDQIEPDDEIRSLAWRVCSSLEELKAFL